MSTLKQAAASLSDAYAKLLKDHKDVSVSHKTFAETSTGVVTLSGTPAAVDAAAATLALHTGTLPVAVPADVCIPNVWTVETETKSEKDPKKTLSIHHVITY